MSKQDVIGNALQNSDEVWKELKKNWFKDKLPGSAFSPGEFVARLIIGHLDMTTDDVHAALLQAEQVSVDDLKKKKILSGSFRITEDTAKIVMAMLLEVPEISREEFKLPNDLAEAVRENSGERYSSTQTNVGASRVLPKSETLIVKECPHCKHDFERCKNGYYNKATKPLTANPASQVPTASVSGSCAHVDAKGLCIECSEEETVKCAGCRSDVVSSKAIKCKDFKDCESSYCPACAVTSLSPNGYCDSCSTLYCSDCSDTIDRENEKRCINKNCTEEDQDFCDDCALRNLNKKGLCTTCSKEDMIECSKCNDNFTQSLLVKCKDFDHCGNQYCPEDAKTEVDQKGFCGECAEFPCSGHSCENVLPNGSEIRCANVDCPDDYAYCTECSKRYLNKSRKCNKCSGEQEWTCDGPCDKVYISSRLKKCNNFDSCQTAFCQEDARNNLDRRGLCKDCAV